MFKKYALTPVALLVTAGHCVYGADVANGSVKAVPVLTRTLDLKPVPSDAPLHHSAKWSDDLFLYVNDDAAAPQIYAFDKSGKAKLSGMIQVPDADHVCLNDYAASPDGDIWTAGHAISRAGQGSFFIARIARDGADVHIIRTPPYYRVS